MRAIAAMGRSYETERLNKFILFGVDSGSSSHRQQLSPWLLPSSGLSCPSQSRSGGFLTEGSPQGRIGMDHRGYPFR